MKIGPITPAATAPPCKTPTIDPSDFVPNIILPNVPRIGMMLPKPTPNRIMKGAAINIELTVTNCRYMKASPIKAATVHSTRR